ncbi:hypothetical protein [Pseudomonas prosekii]|uniref:hypothetical protein n=1 Tax=Pseudomonas prosekii TaxID=1148509 RepID=UPI0011EB6027|nr:hypothetical protein [Pseudomonas prosekii]
MNFEINCERRSTDISLDDQALKLIGKPIKITFINKSADRLQMLQNLWSVPDKRQFKYIEISARTHTSSGFVDSQFCLASKNVDDKCTLFTTSHRDSAILKNEFIKFQSLLKTRKDTRIGGHELPEILKSFHYWLASEIVISLSNTNYFASLHNCNEIQYINLISLSTLRKNRPKIVWGIAEPD